MNKYLKSCNFRSDVVYRNSGSQHVSLDKVAEIVLDIDNRFVIIMTDALREIIVPLENVAFFECLPEKKEEKTK